MNLAKRAHIDLFTQSDVSLAGASKDRRERAGAICPRLGEFQHTGCCVLQLQGIDLILHIGHAVPVDRIQDLLRVSGRCLVDACGIKRGLIARLVDRTKGIAAILLPYRLFILYFL